MRVKSIWLRQIHKWVGLVIGLQFLLWALSGTAMALLDMEQVEGGPRAEAPAQPVAASAPAWAKVQRQLRGRAVTGLVLRSLPGGWAYEVATPAGVRLFSAADGAPLRIDSAAASAIAAASHPDKAPVTAVAPLRELSFAVREHQLPIWRVDFADQANSSYFVSGSTGALLERRNDSWRWWDFFWMLHIMDYSKRTSFNHPLIIMVGFAMAWLAVTGFWLLFRTMWRHDFAWLRGRRARPGQPTERRAG